MFNKIKSKKLWTALTTSMLLFMSTSASAQIAENTSEYWRDIFGILQVAVVGLAFVAGVGVLVFSGVMFAKDYIFAKSDHEKSFSIGKLFAGMVIGGVVALPTAGIMFGTDLLIQEDSGYSVDEGAFERPGN